MLYKNCDSGSIFLCKIGDDRVRDKNGSYQFSVRIWFDAVDFTEWHKPTVFFWAPHESANFIDYAQPLIIPIFILLIKGRIDFHTNSQKFYKLYP